MPDQLRAYLDMQRRYAHVTPDDVGEIERYVRDLNALVDKMTRSFQAPA